MVVDALEDAEQEAFLSEADGETDGQGGALAEEEVLIEDTADKDNSLENVANIDTSSNANEDVGIDSGDDEWMFDDQASDEFEITDIEEYTSDPGLEAVSLALVDELSDETEATTITVKLTAQNGNAFLCAPYLSLSVSSDLSDKYGFSDSVTDGVSALDALIAAHVQKYGESFTKDSAGEYLTVDENGAVTEMFDQTAAYGTGIAVKCVIQETSAAALEVKSGETIAFFCYTDAAKSDKAVRFSTSSKAANAVVTENIAYAAENPKGIYLYDTEKARILQLATVDAQTGALTPIEGLISNENGIASLALKEGTYLLTAYDTEAGVVMPVLQYRAAKIPEISSLKVYRKDTGAQIAVTPEWDGKKISGYTTEAVPDSLLNFTTDVRVAGIEGQVKNSVTYDDVQYKVLYSGSSGQLTTSWIFVRPINGVLTVCIDNMASRRYDIEVKRYATLKSLSVEGLNETFDDEVFAYNAFIPADAETCTITAGKYTNSSAISINEKEVDSGAAYTLPVTWTDGKMEVAITVSNTSYESRTYTVTLYPKNIENTPKIVKQPVSAEYNYEEKASALSVLANGNSTLSYQWYRNSSESAENAEPLENASKNTYTPDTTQPGTWYYFCKVTNTIGEETYSVNSACAKVTVGQNPAPKITVSSNQEISTIEGYPQEKGLVYEYGADDTAVLTAKLTAEVEGGTW